MITIVIERIATNALSVDAKHEGQDERLLLAQGPTNAALAALVEWLDGLREEGWRPL